MDEHLVFWEMKIKYHIDDIPSWTDQGSECANKLCKDWAIDEIINRYTC